MNNVKYIEIDSTFRDRNLWPFPGQFEIPISQSGRKFTAVTAIDPVSEATPFFAWSSNRFNAAGAGAATLTGTVSLVAGIDAIGNQQTFIMDVTGAEAAQELANYYIGAVIRDTTIGEERRIVDTRYLGVGGANDNLQITVESPFSTTFANGDALSILDPTEIDLRLDGIAFSNPQIFVPAGRLGADAYIGDVLYNETRDEYRIVSAYDPITHMLSVDTTGSAVSTRSSGPVTNWLATDNYSLRSEMPLFFVNGGGATTTTVVLTGGSTTNNVYNNYFIRVQGSTAAADRYTYTIYPTTLPGVAPIGEIRRIVSYNGATQTATVSPPFSAAPNNNLNFEVLVFSYDNLNPFIYMGSVSSQQQEVCYEIELLDLVLPNDTLAVGQGSRIAFYPYVYVEFANVSGAGSGTINAIYSNNPNSSRMMFRAPIDDVPNPLISSFIKIDGDGMVQTLRFKPNDNLKFSVRLPNGEVYRNVQSDYYSPSAPNALIQISAIFGVRRVIT